MENREGTEVEKGFYSCMEKLFMGDESLTVLMSDNGNHFTEYGIYENMILFFDRTKEHNEGCLAAYCDAKGDNYLSLEKQNDRYIGLLIMSMKGYGCSDAAKEKSICNG